jgi:pimeloyl-ACP methyl ester carboxylesterase
MPYIELSGARVEYRQQGTGPDLLLLHSLLTDLTVFDEVVGPLARTHRVTRFNLPGVGASSPVALKSVHAYADHVAAVMDALDIPVATAVFGNGFGGFVALALAVAHASRFDELIVADALSGFPAEGRVPFRAMAEKVTTGGMDTVLDAAISRMFRGNFTQAHPAVVSARRQALSAFDPGCFAQACLALAALDLKPSLSRIRKRTLILCGAEDQTTPAALAQELAAAIPGALYRDITECGHCPMLEQPEALVSEIGRFLMPG